MSLGSFLRHWFRRSSGRGVRLDRLLAARLGVEHLEDRCVPAALPSGIAVFQPNSATWYLHNSPTPGAPDVTPFAYGGPNWIPVAGDWNGDGQVSAGVYDPSTATWYLKNDNSAGAPSITPFRYGAPGWIPVVGDWTGSGHDGIGVYDPGTGTWYLRNETSAGAPDAGQFRYGAAGWLPVVGDWDGNGTTTIGAFDPGFATFYLRNSNSAGAPDSAPFAYGMSGWLPVAGDWNGDGTTTIGVFDPGAATWYLRNSNNPGAPDSAPFAYGMRGWAPLALPHHNSHIPVDGSPPPGSVAAPQIVLRVPVTAAGNSFTASVSVINDPAVNTSTAFFLDVDLNHDGKFDGPGESSYATGILDARGAGQVTVTGLVTGNYRVQAHFVDPSTGATIKSTVQTAQMTPPPANPIPVSFEQNLGQTDGQVSYLARAAGGQAYFTEQGVMLAFYSPDTTASNSTPGQDTGGQDAGGAISTQPSQLPGGQGATAPPTLEIAERMQFQGGNPNPLITAEDRLANVTNYLIGNDPSQWHTNVPNFQQVSYHDIYPGINAVFHGSNSGGLEFDFQVAPGADPSQIVLSFPDLSGVTVAPNGQLQLVTAAGNINMAAPVVYQNVAGGGTVAIPSSFAVRGTNQVGLTIGQYNHSLPLIVDPVFTGATYLGGSQNDELAGNGPPIITPTDSAMTSDSGGSIFVTGSTNSTNYPVTTGVFQSTSKGKTDVFVTKMNGQGTVLAWSTYLGGTNDESGYGIAVDTGDDAYIVGGTTSTDFPTTAGVFQTTNKATGASKNAFVTKLNAQGSALVYSTYLGGSTSTQMNSVAVDLGGDAYVTGTGGHDYPTTPGAFRATSPGPGSTNDGVLTKLNAQGTALVYSTFYSGFFASTPSQVMVDSLGQAVIGGSSFSSDLPMTPGAYQTTYGGGLSDGFLAKFNPAGSNLVWATYVGGPDTDSIESMTGDSSGNVYATGYELFGSGGFPTTPGAFQTTPKGGQEAFVFKMSPDGRNLLYSTYLGGAKDDRGLGIALDGFGNAYVTGTTLSNDFPTTGNAIQPTNKGGILSGDAFLVQLNSVATQVVYGSYIGGAKDDYGLSVQLGPTLLYLAGTTSSTDFPIATGAFQTTNAGGDDVWISAVDQLVPAGGFGSPGFSGSSATGGSGGGGGGGGGGGILLNGLSDDRFERNDTSDQPTMLGAFGPGSVTFTGLTINLHTDNTFDQDWYQISPTQAGTLTVSANNIASGGDLWLRLFKVNSNGTLSQLGSSTFIGSTIQQVAVAVNAGDQIDAWVFGYNFAIGFYNLSLSLA